MKYFQTLPEQEYVFKYYFQTGKNEGCNCADCGTYITNVVQLFGTADKQTYNVGTTCCNKISKDREVFLTPKSVQRKKIFMTEYKKIADAIKNAEKLADMLGGIDRRFIDIEWSNYSTSLELSIFILSKNGVLINTTVDYAQRCFSALKDIFSDYDFVIAGMKDVLSKDWNNATLQEINTIFGDDWRKNKRSYTEISAWLEYVQKNTDCNLDKFNEIGIATVYPEVYAECQKMKGLFRLW